VRSFPLVSALAGLLALAAAASVAIAYATPTLSASGCVRVGALNTVFPGAATVGFTARGPIQHQPARAPVWPGRCAAWWTTYSGTGLSSDVSVTLYKTRRQALVALAEPAFGPARIFPNGAHVRTLVTTPIINGVRSGETGFVASVYRNVFISSTLLCSPPACKGANAIRAQMGIHSRIYAAVRAWG
jgi:hypothetical protein